MTRVYRLSIWWDRFQTYVETYLIRGKVNGVIDTGAPGTSLALPLKAIHLSLTDIEIVLNSHGHYDHVGGDAVIKALSDAQIMIHREDAVFLEDHRRCYDRFYAPLAIAMGHGQELEVEKAAFLEERSPELAVDRPLEDNDVIDLGGGVELRVLHLPGHTPGSVGFYLEGEGILFAGDSVCGLGVPDGSLPSLIDLEAYERSLVRLMGLPIRTILTAHPYRGLHLPPSPERKGQQVKEYLLDSTDAARRLREVLASHGKGEAGRPLQEIADSVIKELPAEMGFKRMAELRDYTISLGTVFWGLNEIHGGS